MRLGVETTFPKFKLCTCRKCCMGQKKSNLLGCILYFRFFVFVWQFKQKTTWNWRRGRAARRSRQLLFTKMLALRFGCCCRAKLWGLCVQHNREKRLGVSDKAGLDFGLFRLSHRLLALAAFCCHMGAVLCHEDEEIQGLTSKRKQRGVQPLFQNAMSLSWGCLRCQFLRSQRGCESAV